MEKQETNNETIFVSIASYRDSECQWTIKDLFEKAKNPLNIFIGICWQYDINTDEDKECFKEDLSKYNDNIKIIRMHYKDAKGPCLARNLCQSLFRGEKYYLQIDSHMRFIKDWDSILISQLNQCQSPERSILTAYPMGYTLPNNIPNYTYPTILTAKNFNSQDKMLRLGSRLASLPKLKTPVKSLFWIAGFSFSYATVINEVPYDPHLDHLFFGEEMLMSARLWTSGYDFYSPTHAILFHLWKRSHRHQFTELEEIVDQRKKSHHRLRSILNLPEFNNNNNNSNSDNNYTHIELDKYALGSKRTLQEYQDFCGVNFSNQSISDNALSGGHPNSFFLNEIIELAIKSQQGVSV